jgi:hypothetical protein
MVLAAAYYLPLDPTGSYAFGDKLTMNIQSCNLIEWTMTVNGQDWTWGGQ